MDDTRQGQPNPNKGKEEVQRQHVGPLLCRTGQSPNKEVEEDEEQG